MKQFRKAEALADDWYGGPEGQERVKSELAKYGLEPEAVVGQAFGLKCDDLEKMDCILTRAEMKRTTMMRGFNEYRAASLVGQIAIVEAEQVSLQVES